MRVTIIGSGYVGLVTGACLAETGNIVMCMDKDVERINLLKAGKIPFHEPGLAPLVERNLSDGRLIFTTDLRSAVRHAPVIFVAVGTPPRSNGEADLSAVEETARAIGAHLDGPAVIVTKSTVPVGTAGRVKTLISDKTTHPFAVIANPEFLKEGAAVHDFMSSGSGHPGGRRFRSDLAPADALRSVHAARGSNPGHGCRQRRTHEVRGERDARDARLFHERDRGTLRNNRRECRACAPRHRVRFADWQLFLVPRHGLWGFMFPERPRGVAPPGRALRHRPSHHSGHHGGQQDAEENSAPQGAAGIR